MPEPVTQAGSSEQTETVSTPAPATGQDKPTTIAEQKAVPSSKGLMDFLDIPPEVQERIAPKAEAEKPSPEPPDPDTPQPPADEKPAEKPAEQPEDEGEEEEGEEEGEEVKPAAQGEKPDKRQKRINRLTRKLHATETQLEAALSHLNKVAEERKERERTEEIAPLSDGPLAYIATEQQLKAEIAKANKSIRWCIANKDGVTTQENGAERFITPEEIAQSKSEWEQVILNAPERRIEIRDFTAERNHFDGLAQQLWPELFVRTSKIHQEAQSILELFPAVKGSSRANYAVGLVLEGARALEARAAQAQGNGEKKPRRDISPRAFEPRVPLAPEAPEPPSRAATPSSQKRLNKAMSDLVKDSDGSAGSLAEAFAALGEHNKTQPSPRAPVRV